MSKKKLQCLPKTEVLGHSYKHFSFFFADLGEARGCSTNTVVILIDLVTEQHLSSPGFTAPSSQTVKKNCYVSQV